MRYRNEKNWDFESDLWRIAGSGTSVDCIVCILPQSRFFTGFFGIAGFATVVQSFLPDAELLQKVAGWAGIGIIGLAYLLAMA